MSLRFGVVVPAAGSGARMGGARKTYLDLSGRPVLLRALDPFLRERRVVAVVVSLPPGDADDPPAWLVEADSRIQVTAGGSSRAHSVYNALLALPSGLDLVAVHDGARPLIRQDVVDACFHLAATGVGAIAGYPASDTLKEVGGDLEVVASPPRSGFWHAQTPQVFPAEDLLQAYGKGRAEEWDETDDAAVFARWGGKVRMVRASPANLKVTHPPDLILARALLEEGGPG